MNPPCCPHCMYSTDGRMTPPKSQRRQWLRALTIPTSAQTFSRWSRCRSSSWAARCSRREAWASRSACASFWAMSSLSRAAFSSVFAICCRRPASSPAQKAGVRQGRVKTSLGPADSGQVGHMGTQERGEESPSIWAVLLGSGSPSLGPRFPICCRAQWLWPHLLTKNSIKGQND